VKETLFDRTANVSLQTIDDLNVRTVTALSVSPMQIAYVAPNQKSLIEASRNPGAWPRAILVGKTPIGFVMLFKPFLKGAIERPEISANQIVLWRFMIDQRYQNQGFGKRAIELIVDECKRFSAIDEIISSFIEGADGPEHFYVSQGFVRTGRLRAEGTEIEIVKPLN
jgi:diamine N-acetyltransferase